MGLPVAAHLLSRTRYVPADFPPTRFVARAVLETTRVNRPRHLLLLLLRILALAAVALAFARPQWTPRATAAPTQEGVALVILVDASASMQRTERGATLFDLAKQAADDQLAALDPARDVAAVVLVDSSPRALLPEAGGNLSLLRDRLAETRCTAERGDAAAALALAEALLDDQPRARRVLLISDGQATNRPATWLAPRDPRNVLDEHRIRGPADNVSLRLVDAAPYPPVLGQPLTLRVEVRNHGDTPRRARLVTAGGTTPARSELTLRPGAVVTRELVITPASPQNTVFSARLEDADAFALDDTAGLVAVPASARRVLLFTDAAQARASENETTASRIALALVANNGDHNDQRIEVDWLTPNALLAGSGRINDAAACWVFTGIAGLDDRALGLMDQHLARGGGVVFVADTEALRSALRGWPASPITLTDDTPAAAAPAVIASARFDHPALRIFEGPARASLVGARLAGAAPSTPASTAAVLLGAADGRPILVSKAMGRGRLVVFNADLSPDASDFSSLSAFVALMHELVRYAAPGPAAPPPLRPGDPLPDGLRLAEKIDTPTPNNRVTLPGLYLAQPVDGEPTPGRWAEVDPAESDFTASPPAGHTPAQGSDAVTASNAAGAPMLRQPAIDLWPYLIAAALLLATAESLALLGFARREASA